MQSLRLHHQPQRYVSGDVTLYYFLPILATLFFGTIMNSFLTTAMGNPRARIDRAFFFTAGKLFLLYFFIEFVSGNLGVLFLFLFYYLLFLAIYKTSFVRGLRFLFLSTVFGTTIKLMLVPQATQELVYFIY
tara:strand:+ start:4536 stop:4931 length:396 start_codon:yes stop_codon:yes gene_type:complete